MTPLERALGRRWAAATREPGDLPSPECFDDAGAGCTGRRAVSTRERDDGLPDRHELKLAEPAVPDPCVLDRSLEGACRPGVPLVSVCISCRAKNADAPPPGRLVEGAIAAALARHDIEALVRPVQCLSVCSRAATVAVQAADGYTFLFGDLETLEDADALAAFVAAYAKADYGFVPWRARPLELRSKIVARLPPALWSPADGRQPG